MLTLQLRELEADGLVVRNVYAEVPPRVEYTLTDIGREIVPVCDALHAWGTRHKSQVAGEISTLSHESLMEFNA